jgi:hypothetical protein
VEPWLRGGLLEERRLLVRDGAKVGFASACQGWELSVGC